MALAADAASGAPRVTPRQTAPPPAAAVTTALPAVVEAPESVSLEITIEPSRLQPYVGSNFGITAEFRNTSKTAVLYLSERTTTLTLPPEMEGPEGKIFGHVAFFPSETDQWDANMRKSEAERLPITIAIAPGRSYRAAWAPFGESQQQRTGKTADGESDVLTNNMRLVGGEFRYIFFAPGDYKAMVQAKVGIGGPPSDANSRTFSETAILKVAAPQFVIIFGAMIGGLISWLLFPQGDPQAPVQATRLLGALHALARMAGACLLSAIVTILLARLSESQFLVKVNITDFWGAIAVGFIAQYLGKAVLDKLIPGRPGSKVAAKPPDGDEAAHAVR